MIYEVVGLQSRSGEIGPAPVISSWARRPSVVATASPYNKTSESVSVADELGSAPVVNKLGPAPVVNDLGQAPVSGVSWAQRP